MGEENPSDPTLCISLNSHEWLLPHLVFLLKFNNNILYCSTWVKWGFCNCTKMMALLQGFCFLSKKKLEVRPLKLGFINYCSTNWATGETYLKKKHIGLKLSQLYSPFMYRCSILRSVYSVLSNLFEIK